MEPSAGAFWEVEVGYGVHALGPDQNGREVAALRVVPHVAFARGSNLRALLDCALHDGHEVVDTRGILDLGHIVARREALAVECVVLERSAGAEEQRLQRDIPKTHFETTRDSRSVCDLPPLDSPKSAWLRF